MVRAPFPWYGGKSKWGELVWDAFGNPITYIEPFAGSLAVLLARPHEPRREIVCDTDGGICNFWRAVTNDPDEVVHWATWPAIHDDLTARHQWLIKWKRDHADKLRTDADYYDAKAAGWWVWGVSNSIGSGFSDGGNRQYGNSRPFVKSNGMGGQGVQQQRKNIPHSNITAFFHDLQERLRRVVVLNRSWEAAITPVILCDIPSARAKRGTTAIFLDPPYKLETRSRNLYKDDHLANDVSKLSFDWAVLHGERYRIAYCCQAGDFELPAGWRAETKTFPGKNKAQEIDKRDMIMFSPVCEERGDNLFS